MDRAKLRSARAYLFIAVAVVLVIAIAVCAAMLLTDSGNPNPSSSINPSSKPSTPASVAPNTEEPTPGNTAGPTAELSVPPTEEPTPTSEVTPTPTPTYENIVYKMTNTDGLNFREGAGKDYNSMRKLDKKTVVEVLESGLGSDGKWSRIKVDEQIGYVSTSYLVDCPKGPLCVVDHVDSSVNIRENPDRNSALLIQLEKGSMVLIVQYVDNTWVKIETQEGLVGYCWTKYLEPKN